jgi:hypothetical protein
MSSTKKIIVACVSVVLIVILGLFLGGVFDSKGSTPTDEDSTPTDEDSTPTDEDETPTDEDETPTDEDETPVDETPTDEDETPVDETPVDETPMKIQEDNWILTKRVTYDTKKYSMDSGIVLSDLKRYTEYEGYTLSRPYLPHIKQYAKTKNYALFLYTDDDTFAKEGYITASKSSIPIYRDVSSTYNEWYSKDPLIIVKNPLDIWNTTSNISVVGGRNLDIAINKSDVKAFIESKDLVFSRPYLPHVKKYALQRGLTLFSYWNDDNFDKYQLGASSKKNLLVSPTNSISPDDFKYITYSQEPLKFIDNWKVTKNIWTSGKFDIVISKSDVKAYTEDSLGLIFSRPYLPHVKNYTLQRGITIFLYTTDNDFDKYKLSASSNKKLIVYPSTRNGKFTWYSQEPLKFK